MLLVTPYLEEDENKKNKQKAFLMISLQRRTEFEGPTNYTGRSIFYIVPAETGKINIM